MIYKLCAHDLVLSLVNAVMRYMSGQHCSHQSYILKATTVAMKYSTINKFMLLFMVSTLSGTSITPAKLAEGMVALNAKSDTTKLQNS